MPLNVLVALGPYEASFNALDFATDLYEHVDDAEITVIHIGDEADEESRRLVEDAENHIAESNFDGESEIEMVGEDGLINSSTNAGAIVTDVLDQRDVDHVFMGRPSKSVFKHLLSGSATSEVLDSTSMPVTLVGTDYDEPVRHLSAEG